MNGGQLPAQSGIVGLLDQQRSDLGGRHFLNAAQELFDRPELRDQLDRGLLPDTFHAGDIVRGVAHEPHHLDHSRRFHAEPRTAVVLPEPLVFHRVVDAHRRRQQLEHVLVAGDDHYPEPPCLRLAGQRADEIIGFVPGEPDHRQPEGLDHAMDVRDLRLHSLRHGRPVCLILLELLMTEGWPFFIERHSQGVRPVFAQDLHEHRGKAVDRICLQPLGIRQGGQGEIGSVNVGAAVNQVEGRHGERVCCTYATTSGGRPNFARSLLIVLSRARWPMSLRSN